MYDVSSPPNFTPESHCFSKKSRAQNAVPFLKTEDFVASQVLRNSSLCRTKRGYCGPRLEAKFVYPSDEHGLCKMVTALNRDLGKGFRSAAFLLSRAAHLRAWQASESIKKSRMPRHCITMLRKHCYMLGCLIKNRLRARA